MWQKRSLRLPLSCVHLITASLNASENTLRPELPPKFSLSTGSALALLLAALLAARAGYIDYAWEAAPISPAFADGHRSGERSGEA